MKTVVHFLYAYGQRFRGSVVMRALQLAAIGDDHLGAEYDFRPVALPKAGAGAQAAAVRDLRGAVIVLTKALTERLEPEALDHLKRTNIAVLADWIDKRISSPHADAFDGHIAASRTQARALRARYPGVPTYHVTHHVDPRLARLSFGSIDALRAVYLGHPDNARHLGRLADRVTVLAPRDGQAMADLLGDLTGFNMHYAVRAGGSAPEMFKPFTKGFTAAACRSNILVQRGANDAEDYLGADYPYLIDRSDRATVAAMLDRAREEFGGPEWLRGLDRMRDVASRSSRAHVAGDLRGMLRHVVGRRGAVPVARLA